MDKIDIEILWTLRQSYPQALGIQNMAKENKRLSLDDELKDKLQSLENDEIVKSANGKNGDKEYTITEKGDRLIWNGETWNMIFNLIKLTDPEKYTSNDIRRITDKSLVETVKNIEYLRKNLKIIEGQSKGFKLYFALSEKGRSFDSDSIPE